MPAHIAARAPVYVRLVCRSPLGPCARGGLSGVPAIVPFGGAGGFMWAHSVNVCGRRHRLSAHSRATADLARAFAAPFGAGGLAAALGLLHDAGKASTAWQRRLLMVEAARGKGGCAAQGTRRAIGLVDGRSGRDGDPGSSRRAWVTGRSSWMSSAARSSLRPATDWSWRFRKRAR
jgi:hypothetical protein